MSNPQSYDLEGTAAPQPLNVKLPPRSNALAAICRTLPLASLLWGVSALAESKAKISTGLQKWLAVGG